ncbi:MAG: site-specific integrase [Armatimonadetes bacterium]|nr:site-specific integrase [Armatimonadota bacterium]
MSGELFDPSGKRKYLSGLEREAFLKAADCAPREVRTFCALLHVTGCRITEALELTYDRVDLSESAIIFETLKKRREGVYRAVPVPSSVLDALNLVHGVRERQASRTRGKGERLWAWSRATAWRRVKEVMEEAGIDDGPQATPKRLRHGFGVNAVSKGVPLNMLSKWMGHAQLSTTAIYADAVGAEEKNIAARMW